ncbi:MULTISPECIES: homoserine O-acetyltransferase MetX [Janibacter]|uniref:Homoserine O-acetyltransferase n=1 Tax=Janibacter indicus TaxID=857417 RepID=A0A1W2AE06_9MICO|nr:MULTISPECIES: homoserine O-acetyltransferase [Janibacter]QNF95272.1 homoserine O-acetyltransferase [Janibacter sp. YB324]SMC58896.1 homoserine O-acetyltransferase [Janibacter indicus]
MSVTTTPPASTALWRDGDHPGERRFVSIGRLELESGESLPDVVLAYETWGRLRPERDNAVLVEHALTGDSHVVGEAGPGHPTAGWWPGLIGQGAPLDDDYFVIAINVLGGCQGSTGPGSAAPDGRPWGSRFPRLTIRDQVAAEARLADVLGIERWHTVIGGSMGGMRTLEWVASHPERVGTAIALATGGYATAEQIGWSQAQILAIRNDPWFAGGDYYDHPQGPEAGLAIARRIAHITYRSELELHERFDRRVQDEPAGPEGRPRYTVESYLDHHGGKLARRFDANSYAVLSEAMNSHDLGRDRGGMSAALQDFTGRLVVAPVDSDRLYPPRLSHEVVAARPGTQLRTISSAVGHDGFLTEVDQVAELLRDVLRGD